MEKCRGAAAALCRAFPAPAVPCMEPVGSPLDPGFSQQGMPCLIVEDSQPEGAGPEQDAERAFLGVLGRRLPLPRSLSPVLVSAPRGVGAGLGHDRL